MRISDWSSDVCSSDLPFSILTFSIVGFGFIWACPAIVRIPTRTPLHFARNCKHFSAQPYIYMGTTRKSGVRFLPDSKYTFCTHPLVLPLPSTTFPNSPNRRPPHSVSLQHPVSVLTCTQGTGEVRFRPAYPKDK